MLIKIVDLYLKLSCKDAKMKNILSILTASFILLSSSFTFSSCKNCDGNKNKGKDNGKSNPITNRDKDNPDNPVIDGDEDVPVLDDYDLIEVGRHLRDRGASDDEIKEMKKIATEDFGEDIGRVIFNGTNHYYYRDKRRDHHGQPAGTNDCALYAMKRFLFVLGRHPGTGIDKDLWYRHTDDQLREMIFESLGGELGYKGHEIIKKHTETIESAYLKTLMRNVGIPPERCFIYYENDVQVPVFFLLPVLSKKEYAASMAETEGKIVGIKKRAQALLESARVAKNKIQLKVNEVKNAHEGEDVQRQQALQEARQALLDVNVASGEMKDVIRDMDSCKGVFGRDVFIPVAEIRMLDANKLEIRQIEVKMISVVREARNIKIPSIIVSV
jgi:hypothetical protein